MVKFNRKKLQYVTPELSKDARDAIVVLFDTTADNILEVAKVLTVTDKLSRQDTMMLTATATIEAAIPAVFIAMGADPGQLKQELVSECIKLITERLHREL